MEKYVCVWLGYHMCERWAQVYLAVRSRNQNVARIAYTIFAVHFFFKYFSRGRQRDIWKIFISLKTKKKIECMHGNGDRECSDDAALCMLAEPNGWVMMMFG